MSRSAADKPLAAKLAITTIDGTIEGGKMTFSKLIEGKGKDKTASFLADVTKVKDGRAPEFEGTVVTAAKFGQLRQPALASDPSGKGRAAPCRA